MDQDLRRGRGVADGAVKAEWETTGCAIACMGFNLIPPPSIPEIRVPDEGLASAPEMTAPPLFEAAKAEARRLEAERAAGLASAILSSRAELRARRTDVLGLARRRQ